MPGTWYTSKAIFPDLVDDERKDKFDDDSGTVRLKRLLCQRGKSPSSNNLSLGLPRRVVSQRPPSRRRFPLHALQTRDHRASGGRGRRRRREEAAKEVERRGRLQPRRTLREEEGHKVSSHSILELVLRKGIKLQWPKYYQLW